MQKRGLKIVSSQLKVVETLKDRDKYGNILVRCICPYCNSIFTIRSSQLNSTKSCGCMKGNRHLNTYKICGDITEIYDHKGNVCLIDTEDLDKVIQMYWYRDSRGYWLHHVSRNHSIYLHKFVMNVTSKDIIVDHIDHMYIVVAHVDGIGLP